MLLQKSRYGAGEGSVVERGLEFDPRRSCSDRSQLPVTIARNLMPSSSGTDIHTCVCTHTHTETHTHTHTHGGCIFETQMCDLFSIIFVGVRKATEAPRFPNCLYL